MGPLMSTSLFQNDMARVVDLKDAVNARIEASGRGTQEFGEEEVLAALRRMGEMNQIMFLEESGEVYKL